MVENGNWKNGYGGPSFNHLISSEMIWLNSWQFTQTNEETISLKLLFLAVFQYGWKIMHSNSAKFSVYLPIARKLIILHFLFSNFFQHQEAANLKQKATEIVTSKKKLKKLWFLVHKLIVFEKNLIFFFKKNGKRWYICCRIRIK